MTHQWPQFDHHDMQKCRLSDSEQQAVIEAYEAQNKDAQSFDDVINEIQGE